ncbi:hypothetical protein KDN24_06560 [Bacillus sp. Bva_UNVM-123]|uniref:hypothetical protein n=1 Tax=Bacillus sp. Bva_UNVM-123 TaxID=2829798 RepID=UPI00391F3520
MKKEYDFEKIYDFLEYPDKVSGRCDNCGKAHFKSKIENRMLIRECRNCGLKKRI